jgi:hypothetical protein
LQLGEQAPKTTGSALKTSANSNNKAINNDIAYVMKSGFKMPKKQLSGSIDLILQDSNLQLPSVAAAVPSVATSSSCTTSNVISSSLKDKKQLLRPGTAPAQGRR